MTASAMARTSRDGAGARMSEAHHHRGVGWCVLVTSAS